MRSLYLGFSRFYSGKGKWWEERTAGALVAFFFVIGMSCVCAGHSIWGRATPPPWQILVGMLRLDQKWNMFAPNPPGESYWISIPAIFRGDVKNPKATRNLFALGGPVRRNEVIDIHKSPGYEPWARPPYGWVGTESGGLQAPHYAHQRWHKFFDNYWGGVKDKARRDKLRLSHGKLICRSWNAGKTENDPDQLMVFEVVFFTRKVSNEGKLLPTEKRMSAWTHFCFDDALTRGIKQPLPGSPISYNVTSGVWLLKDVLPNRTVSTLKP